MEGNRTEPGAPAGFVNIKFGVAHALHAAGHHHVGVFGLDQHGGVQNGLQPGGAAAVQLITGDLYGQVGLQCGQPADGRIFPVGVTVAKNHVIDFRRVHSATLDGLLDDRGGQFRGGYIPDGAAEVAHGRAYW